MGTRSDSRHPRIKPISAGSIGRLVSFLSHNGLILVLLLAFAFPFYWMFSSALKPRAELFLYINPLSWRTFIPQDPTLVNFTRLVFDPIFVRSVANSLMLAVVNVTLSLVLGSMLAYVLAYLQFPGRGFVFVLVLLTLFVPFEVRMIPTFLVIQDLNLQDSYLGVLLPWITDGFVIFLFRQHFLGIPHEIHEAAIIDGASEIRTYWNIMLPNIKPALVTAAMLQFLHAWDAYVWPLIVLRDPTKSVLQIELAKLFTDQEVLWELVFAGSVLATLPALIIFLLLQKYYVQGVTSSGIKG